MDAMVLVADAAVLVSAFHQIIHHLSSAFTAPTAITFAQIVTGWVLAPGCGTVTGMIRALGAQATKTWTVYEKFFYRAEWSMDDLGRLLVTGPLAKHLDTIVEVAIDDTTCGPRGKHVAFAEWWKDASAHTRGPSVHWSHNWVVLAITIRLKHCPAIRMTFPVMFALHRKQKDCTEKDPYRTLPQLAREMLVKLSAALPDHVIALAIDGLYATKDLFGDLPKQVFAVSRLRKNAELRTTVPPVAPEEKRKGGRPRVRGTPLPDLDTLTRQATDWRDVTLYKQGRKVERQITGLTCQWYHVCGRKPVRVVLVRDPGGVEDDLRLVCSRTEPDLDDAQTVQRYYDRWGIEECIQEGKAQMGMERLRGWCKKTVTRQTPLAMLINSLIKLWYLDHAADRPDLQPERMPWYDHKRHPSFRDMRAALRRCLWEDQFSFLKEASFSSVTPEGIPDGKSDGLSNLQNPCNNAKTLDALKYALYIAA